MQKTNYEVRVGLFSLFALILLVWGWAWLKSFSLFHPPQRFIARFDDVAGLSNNATVNVQGVRVGTVEYLTFTPEKKIDVHLKITETQVSVPRGADISIQTLGMVGAKYIEITLPRNKNGVIVQGPPLQADDVLAPPGEGDPKMGIVHNPVRFELIANNVARHVDEIVTNIDTEAASRALNNLSTATAKLDKNMDRLRDAADSVKAASNSIASTSNKFGHTADEATEATRSAETFFHDGDTTVKNIDSMATEFRTTSSKVNKLLNNPNFSSDIKETMTQARQTAETIRSAIGDVNGTLKDKNLRDEILGLLTKLQTSTENIRCSMEIVNKVANDQGLRSDIKDAVHSAKEAMAQAQQMLSEPQFKGDVTSTLGKIRAAATNVNVASKQIQQILDKRAPLLQMMFRRPGKITPQTCAPNPPAQCPPTQAPAPGLGTH